MLNVTAGPVPATDTSLIVNVPEELPEMPVAPPLVFTVNPRILFPPFSAITLPAPPLICVKTLSAAFPAGSSGTELVGTAKPVKEANEAAV